MAQFLNTKETLVTEAIDGLLASSGGRANPAGRLSAYQGCLPVGLGQVEGRPGIRWRVWSRTGPRRVSLVPVC